MAIIFLTPEEVKKVQEKTLPNSGPPNKDKLCGALGRVETLNYYKDCSDLFTLAAMYLIALTKAHAFNDANKRTAFQATSIFLLRNNFELERSPELIKLTVLSAESKVERLKETSCALKLLSNYKNDLFNFMVEDFKTKSSIELIKLVILSATVKSEPKCFDLAQLMSKCNDTLSQLEIELELSNFDENPSSELIKLCILSLEGDASLDDIIFILKLLSKHNNDLLDEVQSGY